MTKNIIIAILFTLILLGCTSQQPPPTPTPSQQQPIIVSPNCRLVSEEVPSIREVCENNVGRTETVCSKKSLSYELNYYDQINICTADGDCAGKDISSCSSCKRIMSRCQLNVTNKDPLNAGNWGVRANFTVNGRIFEKEESVKTIGPLKTETFDFYQIYDPYGSISIAQCNLMISSPPIIDECHDETRTVSVCRNVTESKTIQKEVCN